MAKTGEVIHPAGRISTIAEINEANAQRIPIDYGMRDPKGSSAMRVGPTAPPVSVIDVVMDGLTVELDASRSFDEDGRIDAYDWNFGDGTAHGTTAAVEHTYATAGIKVVTLVVTDNFGDTGVASITLDVAP